MTTATNNGTVNSTKPTYNGRIDWEKQTAICNVFMGTDYSSITSPKGTVIIAMLGDGSDWSSLSDAEVKLLGKLRAGSGTDIVLTFAETKLYGSIAQRFPDTAPHSPVPVAVPPVALAPVAVVPATLVQPATAPTAPPVAPPVASNGQNNGQCNPVPVVPTAPQTTSAPAPVVAPVATSDNATYATAELDYFRERRERMIAEHRARQMRQLATDAQDVDVIWEVKYYIPSAVSQPSTTSGREPMFADLARRMRQARLLKFDGSCYYGRERHIPQHIGKEIEQWNKRPEIAATEFLRPCYRLQCAWEAYPVTAERMAEMKGKAFLKLLDVTMEVYEAMRDSVATASATHEATLTKLDEEQRAGGEGATNRKLYDAMDRRVKAMASAISRARNELKLALECAEAFGERDELQELADDISRQIREQQRELEALRLALRSQARD